MAGFLAKHLLTEPPIAIKTTLNGCARTEPPQGAELSLREVRRAVEVDRLNGDVHFPGRIVSVISEHMETSIKPPRYLALLGDTRIHEARFRCTAEVAQPDGQIAEQVFFVTKQQFEMLGSSHLRPR